MIRSAKIRTEKIRNEKIRNLKIRSLRLFSVSLLVLLMLVLLLSAIAFGQGGAATGDLHVTVKDPRGSLVTNATVTVSDVAKGVERTATGDGQGGYSAQQLPPGSYTVTVEAPGFGKAEAKDVGITVGGLVELPVALAVATGREVVEVSSQAELVETSRTSTTDTIGQRRIDNLPINGRNYINFTLTDSQVVRDNAPNTGAAPTSGLNMSGQRARSNLVNVDGADATDNSVNGVRSTVSQEAVQEFQIITNNYSAEYGRAAGGVVNIITRSGSNEFHGDVFGYLRNRNFQAVNPFSTVSNPAYTRVQAGRCLRRSDQERQDVLLFFLRNYAAARDGILQHRASKQHRILRPTEFRYVYDRRRFDSASLRHNPSNWRSGGIPGAWAGPARSNRSRDIRSGRSKRAEL